MIGLWSLATNALRSHKYRTVLKVVHLMKDLLGPVMCNSLHSCHSCCRLLLIACIFSTASASIGTMFPMAATVAPSVGNWEQPQAVAAMASEPVAPLAVRDVVAKYGDKGDQHDSGIDNSENLNSAESSSRSSPSAENKLRVEESKVCVKAAIR